jgi:putative hydrolase of the HAD superfamily
MIRAIAFDCFGVILNDYGHNWVDSSGLSDADQAEVHSLFRERDLGRLDGDEYYEQVAKVAGVDAVVLKAKEHGVAPLEPMLLSYIKNDLASRYELYVASNASANLLTELLHQDGFDGIFKHVFVSSEMGVIKPQPEFYTKLLSSVDVSAEGILFVDDRKPNVDAAVSAGMQGYHYNQGFAVFKEYLEATM